jgi:hypothetical protein
MDARLAVEQCKKPRTHGVLELGLGHARRLNFAGHDPPRGIGGRGLKYLSREKDQRDLDDGKQNREKWENDEREFDDRRTVFAAPEPARVTQQTAARPPGGSKQV